MGSPCDGSFMIQLTLDAKSKLFFSALQKILDAMLSHGEFRGDLGPRSFITVSHFNRHPCPLGKSLQASLEDLHRPPLLGPTIPQPVGQLTVWWKRNCWVSSDPFAIGEDEVVGDFAQVLDRLWFAQLPKSASDQRDEGVLSDFVGQRRITTKASHVTPYHRLMTTDQGNDRRWKRRLVLWVVFRVHPSSASTAPHPSVVHCDRRQSRRQARPLNRSGKQFLDRRSTSGDLHRTTTPAGVGGFQRDSKRLADGGHEIFG